MVSKLKRPHGLNRIAKGLADIATGEFGDQSPQYGKNPAAVALGRLGGKKGGKARAKKLTPLKRREIAQKAARARWASHNKLDD